MGNECNTLIGYVNSMGKNINTTKRNALRDTSMKDSSETTQKTT